MSYWVPAKGGDPDGRHTTSRLNGRERERGIRPHRVTAGLLLVGLSGAALGAVAVARTVSANERALLVEKTAETSTVFNVLVSTVQSSLTTVAAATSGGARVQVLDDVVSSPAGKQFAGLALLELHGSSVTTAVRRGTLLEPLPGDSGQASATLEAALLSSRSGFALTGLVGTGAQRHLGVLLGPPLAPAQIAIYAELAVPAGQVMKRSGQVFSNLDYALYLGRETEANLIFASTATRPLNGTRAVALVAPGGTQTPAATLDSSPGSAVVTPGDLVLVVSPLGSLVGGFEATLPWLIAGVGVLTALAFAFGVELALRRRDLAVSLASDLETKNRALDRAVGAEREALTALGESERNFRRLFDANPNAMWAYDVETLRFLAVNDAAVSRYGWTREEFLAMQITDIRPPDEIPRLLDSMSDDRPPMERSGAWRHRFKDGRVIDVEVTSHLQDFAGRKAALVLAHDVSEQRALEEQLRHQAFHDPLTNLANRALFFDRLEHALARVVRAESGCGVLLFDLDDFKTINDSLGHAAGDELLIEVGHRVSLALRPADTASRLGGDEFAVILEDVACAEDAERVADRILESIRNPVHLLGHNIVVSATVGIAIADPGTAITSAAEVMRNADVAMYRAKSTGRGQRLTYISGMQALVADRLALANDLRFAQARGELRVVYQPLLALGSRRVVGVEALVRWTHPDRGPIPPDVFIPLAEEAGLVVGIDRWVLEQACRHARAWRDVGMPLRVSVNISGRDLDAPGLFESVMATLEATGLEPSLLELELTEGAVVRQRDQALEALRRLRQSGVSVAIDDFGTGYSMLSRLRDFPVDRIKIDRAFVQEVTALRPEAPLVAAMVLMAKALELDVVAEGVETIDQLAFLEAQGCDQVQGYFLSRPAEVEDVPAAVAAATAAYSSRSSDVGDRRRPRVPDRTTAATAMTDRPTAVPR
jgi:diguanylate cyclase (GGDEF)-like protein/PAS domain S-box-containing protein